MFFKKDRNSRLRAIRIYLVFLLILTLLLFIVSIASFNEQHDQTFQQSTHRVSSNRLESFLSYLPQDKDTWLAAISTIMFLPVIGFGLYFFIRVSWDIRWFQLRSDFVSGVSHEFKTPLSLIRLYSETLASNEMDFSPEDRRNYLRIIARESERLSGLINNVLDFSKMESGPKPSPMNEGDLSSVISQAMQDYSDYLMYRGFEVKTSIQPQLPPVRFNSEQILQAILNLLDNARKYSGASRLLRLNAWTDHGEVVVEVKDHGIGIPADEKSKIFQAFYRISSQDSKGGCGLGLYLVDQVMKEHGGRVEVDSELNRGSAFRLIFPASLSK